MASPLHVFPIGVMGTASIARKNIRAMKQSTGPVCVGAVASRSLERAKLYAGERGLVEGESGFDDGCFGAYDEMLSASAGSGGGGKLRGVYVPLPTSMHVEWVPKAAAAGLHVLCEKPAARTGEELAGIIAACRAEKKLFMDGVMFMHNPRLAAMREAIDAGAIGATGAQHVTSAFNFRGDAAFFSGSGSGGGGGSGTARKPPNIRVQAAGDPLGCVGDLGWYCIRLSLWAFGWDIPSHASGTIHAATAEGVPTSFSGTLVWVPPEEPAAVAGGMIAPRTATFHCSFTHGLQQYAHVTGEAGSIECDDFVIPRNATTADFTVSEHEFVDQDCHAQITSRRITTASAAPQEVLMWETFARTGALVDGGGGGSGEGGGGGGGGEGAREEGKGELNDGDFWGDVALATQTCIDALMQSARSGGNAVPVTRPEALMEKAVAAAVAQP